MRRFVHILIAYAFAIGSAALASLYGFISAEGMMAYAKAGILCLVAFGGCHGPAFVAHLRRAEGWSAAFLASVATAACVFVTLWGGLGTLASGGAQMQADRAKVSSDVSRDKADRERLTGERQVLPAARPAAAVSAGLATSRASSLYKDSEGCDPEKVSGPKTREHCRVFRVLEAELASAKEAARLDGELAEISRRLAKAPSEVAGDPQAVAFSLLTGVPEKLSAALYALCASMALELMGMVAMMVAWSERKAAPRIVCEKHKPIQPEPKPATVRHDLPAPSTQVAHIANVLPMKRPEPKRKTGNVKQFLLTCAAPAEGERVPMKALLTRYREWCAASELEPLSLGGFMDAIDGACKLAGIEIEAEGSTVYCLDVRLSA